MNLPSIVFFDYGHTLAYEDGPFEEAGWSAVLDHAIENPENITPIELWQSFQPLYDAFRERARMNLIEPPNTLLFRSLFERNGLKFDLSLEELEFIYWDVSRPAKPAPGVEKALYDISEMGVRTAVISNMTYSGNTLSRMIEKQLPYNAFDFIVASSDYGFRKPDRFLFDLALKKANVPASEAWHVGDETLADISGAHSAGIFPVWIETDVPRAYLDKSADKEPSFEHLHIRSMEELAIALKGASRKAN